MMTTINSSIKRAIDSAPGGTSGLVIEPWSIGETYGVAADWAQASSPVFFFGPNGWQPRQYQVADFRHNAQAALAEDLREMIEMGGCEEDEDADDLAAEALEF